MFKKKKMNENEPLNEEFLEDETQRIPFADKRRFNDQGERITGAVETSKEPVRTAAEIDLEQRLKVETDRREAAEAKLIGVQAKFEEAKAGLEKETSDMRARLMKTLEDRAKQGQFNFLTTLLPVLDNLNLAITASEKDSSAEVLLGGVKGTARSFEQALLSVSVEAVPSVGSNFNPEIHEAIDTALVEADQDGKVTAEYTRGYKLGDKLLRPAKVQVGKAMAQSAGE
ncbi:MAG: nucleotide exchange factor GrpE [Pyrinomonadaceae bacterium]